MIEKYTSDNCSWDAQNKKFKAVVYLYSYCSFFCKLDLKGQVKLQQRRKWAQYVNCITI